MLKKTLLFLLFAIGLGLTTSCGGFTGKYEYGLHIGSFLSDENESYIFSYGVITIEEITKEEYESLEQANSVAELKSDNEVRKYCSLNFLLRNSETQNYTDVTLSHIEFYSSRNNVYTGNLRVNDGVNDITRFFYELRSDSMSITFDYRESSLVYHFHWANIVETN